MRGAATAIAALTAFALTTGDVQAGSFTFINEANPDRVVHPKGYVPNVVSSFNVTICVDPTSANAADMEIPLQNAAAVYTQKLATTGNIVPANVPSMGFDFESVAVHELGHCLGLGHTDETSSPSEPFADPPVYQYANSADGPDNTWDRAPGSDGLQGTADDLRDDDVNFIWFHKSTNDPFGTQATIDSTTYSRTLADLPGSDTYAAPGMRQVGDPSTTSVMEQGIFNKEAIRTLSNDEISTLKYAMSGLDEIQGNADDYTFTVSYVGQTTSCDVVFDFDAAETTFAVCQTSASINGDHRIITGGNIYLNPTISIPGFTWFFNDQLTAPTPMPMLPHMALVVFLVGMTLLLALVRRRRT